MHLLRCCNKACFLNFRYGLKRSSDNLDSSGLLTTKLLTHQNVYLTSINKFSDRFKVAKPLRFSNFPSSQNKSVVLYSTATVILFLALSFAAVPLYRIYCQSTGKGGRPFLNEEANKKIREMVKRREREITVHFNADTSSMMAWKFRPTQPDIKVQKSFFSVPKFFCFRLHLVKRLWHFLLRKTPYQHRLMVLQPIALHLMKLVYILIKYNVRFIYHYYHNFI